MAIKLNCLKTPPLGSMSGGRENISEIMCGNVCVMAIRPPMIKIEQAPSKAMISSK